VEAGRSVLLILSLLTALNWAVHWYTHTVTYRLFPTVAAAAGGPGFVRYHQAYEGRLPLSVYAPWAALTGVSAVLLAVRPPGLGIVWPLVLLLLNAAIAVLSLILAAPVHRRVDAAGALAEADARALLRANGLRLAVASASLLTVTVLAWQHLGRAA